jgi:Na+/H+ antiporter NhaD/arsenite permease-like protein
MKIVKSIGMFLLTYVVSLIVLAIFFALTFPPLERYSGAIALTGTIIYFIRKNKKRSVSSIEEIKN